MKTRENNPAAEQLVEDITRQLAAALAALRDTKNMSVQRARAIATCASRIIDTAQVEVLLSTINGEN